LGVTAQNLEELFAQAPAGARAAGAWQARLLSRLAAARPDLRARLEAMGVRPQQEPVARMPLFLHGGAWEKTAEYIGTYGDADTRLAWKFLDADVAPGSSFTYQLVPALADDVFLHALVVRHGQQLHLRSFGQEVQVIYLVDYGIAQATGPGGEPLGFYRGIDYGSVVYAPGVGPVLASERFGASSDDPGAVSATNEITLVRWVPGPGATASAASP
jgi:hypothetical protein